MKKFFLTGLFLLGCACLFAQNEEGAKKDRLFKGGAVNLSFGRYTVLGLSPQVGYRFSRLLSAGVGLNLNYVTTGERNAYGNKEYTTSEWMTGLHLYGRFSPVTFNGSSLVNQFFVQVQPEVNYRFGNTTYYRDPYNMPVHQTFKNNAEIVPCVFVGGGAALPLTKGSLSATVLYDLIQQPNSPFGNYVLICLGYHLRF